MSACLIWLHIVPAPGAQPRLLEFISHAFSSIITGQSADRAHERVCDQPSSYKARTKQADLMWRCCSTAPLHYGSESPLLFGHQVTVGCQCTHGAEVKGANLSLLKHFISNIHPTYLCSSENLLLVSCCEITFCRGSRHLVLYTVKTGRHSAWNT